VGVRQRSRNALNCENWTPTHVCEHTSFDLGVKWSQVQILSARPEFLQLEAISGGQQPQLAVANLALAHLRLLVGAAAQVAEARTGFLDAQNER
jgi:hypothetical protein